jgi:pimeloyl-ACP methyl ester carboxylesterase
VTLKSLAGGRAFADVTGAGSLLVVMLHGWRRDRKDLVPVMDEGLPGRVAFLDLPGFGASPPPPSGWGAREYAELVADCVAELRTNGADPADDHVPVVLVGHSFGGRVAVCLAAETGWVSGLVISGVPLLRKGGRKPALRFRVLRALHRRGLVKDTTMERYRHRRGSEDYRAAQGVMRDVLVRTVNESYEDELGRLRCPTRFVWGEHDTAAPISMAREAQRLVHAPTEFVTAKDVGHDVHHARPDVLNREIRALCEAVR